MPQLNPTPWFAIFFFSWIIFLTMLPPKIMAFTFPNEPTLLDTQKPETTPWHWPWH